MRDLAILVILLGMAGLTWLRPWLGVLGLAVLSYLHPQSYASDFMRQAPVFLAFFMWVSLCALYRIWLSRSWAMLPWHRFLDWRLLGMFSLWGWFAVTSYSSLMPWEAWPKYLEVLKLLPPFVLAVLLIDSREKLHYLLLVIALSILLVAVKGGYWAVVLSGFHDRVYGPPGSSYGDNNEFAIAVTMIIPVLFLWLRKVHDHGLRIVLSLGIALAYASAVSSWSRGGMLALGAVTLTLVLHSKRKLLSIPLFLGLAAILFVQLPEQWFGRMESTASYQSDQSAQSRVQVWQIGMDMVQEHPITGGGFNAWPVLTLQGAGGLNWHSAYIQILAEHGYVGFALWVGLLAGTLVGLGWGAGRSGWAKDYGAMLQAMLIAYLVGGLTLGIAYWELPYHLVVLATLIRYVSPAMQPARQA